MAKIPAYTASDVLSWVRAAPRTLVIDGEEHKIEASDLRNPDYFAAATEAYRASLVRPTEKGERGARARNKATLLLISGGEVMRAETVPNTGRAKSAAEGSLRVDAELSGWDSAEVVTMVETDAGLQVQGVASAFEFLALFGITPSESSDSDDAS